MCLMPANGGGPIERKVQMTGGSTFTVSIPKEWANRHGISTGSGLYLYPFEDRLVVARPNPGEPSRRTLNVDAIDRESIEQRIQAAYAAGCDEIAVVSDTGFTAEKRRIASSTVAGLVGMEIASESDRELLARSLLDCSEVSLTDTTDQMCRMALSMHERAIEAVCTESSPTDATAVADSDDDVDRLFALVSRQFHRVLADIRAADELRIDRRAAFTQFRIARQLERVADHAERIADAAGRQQDPPGEDFTTALETVAADARRVVRTAVEGNAGEALLRRGDITDRIDELDQCLYETADEDAYLHGRVLESVRRTAEYGGNVAEARTLESVMNEL